MHFRRREIGEDLRYRIANLLLRATLKIALDSCDPIDAATTPTKNFRYFFPILILC
jgi:hypothetical protein